MDIAIFDCFIARSPYDVWCESRRGSAKVISPQIVGVGCLKKLRLTDVILKVGGIPVDRHTDGHTVRKQTRGKMYTCTL